MHHQSLHPAHAQRVLLDRFPGRAGDIHKLVALLHLIAPIQLIATCSTLADLPREQAENFLVNFRYLLRLPEEQRLPGQCPEDYIRTFIETHPLNVAPVTRAGTLPSARPPPAPQARPTPSVLQFVRHFVAQFQRLQ